MLYNGNDDCLLLPRLAGRNLPLLWFAAVTTNPVVVVVSYSDQLVNLCLREEYTTREVEKEKEKELSARVQPTLCFERTTPDT